VNPVLFIHGATAMGCVIAGAFFLRFWSQSRDRLFAWFAVAFWMLALSYVALGTVAFATEWRDYVFVIRLLAFCTILFGVLEKNRRR
jgi:hypothetical protein